MSRAYRASGGEPAGRTAPLPALKLPTVPLPRGDEDRRAYRASLPARILAPLLLLACAGWTALWAGRHLIRFDLRIVARLVPVRDHTHFLQLLHPLVHLGDTVFVLPVAALACAALYLRGYRRCWSLPLAAALTWAVELACKSLLPQPGSEFHGSSMTINSLIHDPITPSVGAWLQRAAPYPLSTIIGNAGNTTLALASGYPSGTAARGVFALGVVAWLALRLRIPVLSEALALMALLPTAVLGVALVLFAWHWPSDVVGGYLLGLALLAGAIALLRYPVGPPAGRGGREWARSDRPARPRRAGGVTAQPAAPAKDAARAPHSPHSRLPWIAND